MPLEAGRLLKVSIQKMGQVFVLIYSKVDSVLHLSAIDENERYK